MKRKEMIFPAFDGYNIIHGFMVSDQSQIPRVGSLHGSSAGNFGVKIGRVQFSSEVIFVEVLYVYFCIYIDRRKSQRRQIKKATIIFH